MAIILIILVLLLLFGGLGSYGYTHGAGYGGPSGILFVLLIIFLVWYFFLH